LSSICPDYLGSARYVEICGGCSVVDYINCGNSLHVFFISLTVLIGQICHLTPSGRQVLVYVSSSFSDASVSSIVLSLVSRTLLHNIVVGQFVIFAFSLYVVFKVSLYLEKSKAVYHFCRWVMKIEPCHIAPWHFRNVD
jgi:hypothetical protein